MVPFKPLAALAAAAALLAACEARIGSEEERAADEASMGSPEGKAEEGRVRLKAPGVDISINVPESVRSRMQTEGNNEVLPPGSTVSGVHVEGGRGGGGVEIRFAAPQPPDEVAAWYRASGRGANFTISDSAREGAAHRLTGETSDGDRFSVRLEAAAGGGTDGRLAMTERRR